jgi:glycosyltransferase involved in cell wall biosynthesis
MAGLGHDEKKRDGRCYDGHGETEQAMNDSPRISVIIPTYNRSAVLRHAIASVLAQSFGDFELLVVGDCCTDDSAGIVAGFGDPRIRWFNLPANSGHQSGPNNEGLRQARGELIAYLGHDDLWLPHHLQVLTAAIDSRADVVAGITEIVGPGEQRLDVAPNAAVFRSGIWLPPTGFMHRRLVSERVGGWRDYRELSVDPERVLIDSAIAAGFRLVLLPRLTAVKFPAAWRKNVYRAGSDGEQTRWLARIAAEPDIERREMVRLIHAGKQGQMHRIHPYRQLWRELGRGTLSWIASLIRRSRIRLAGKGARIDAARRRKGLPRRP